MTTTTEWLSANSSNDRTPAVGFTTIGAKIVGRIIGTPRIVDTEFGSRLVIELEAHDGSTATGAGEPINAGDVVSVWIKPGAMATAIAGAIKEAGATGLGEGDIIAVQYVADGVASKPGWNPPKQFRARLQPARATVAVDDLI